MNNQIFPQLPEDIDDTEPESAPWSDLVQQDFHVSVYRDRYPVSQGHLLFVPRYNSITVLSQAFSDAVQHGRDRVQAGDWAGFNVGLNYGSAAGQTVAWPHVHLIPRHTGDVADPTGGVRNVIPGRGRYLPDQPRSDHV